MGPHALMIKKSDGSLIEAAATDAGEIKISGSLSAPAGGATEAKQNDAITLLAGGLPAALGAGGGVKIDGSGTALPVSLADAATETTLAALSAKLPAAGTIAQTTSPISLTILASLLLAREPNAQVWRRVACDTSDRLEVTSTPKSATTSSRSSGGTYEEQRGIDFSFSLWQAIVYSETAGYILLVNKGSDAIDTDAPYGSNVYPIQAGQTIEIGGLGAGTYDNFTSGCQAVFSSTPNVVTLGGAHCLFTLKGA